MTVAVRKHPLQGFPCEDDVAREFLHQVGKVGEVGGDICKKFVHAIGSI